MHCLDHLSAMQYLPVVGIFHGISCLFDFTDAIFHLQEISKKLDALNAMKLKHCDSESNGRKDTSRTAKTEHDLANENYLGSTIANVCIVLGVLAFGFTVSYVLKAAGVQHR